MNGKKLSIDVNKENFEFRKKYCGNLYEAKTKEQAEKIICSIQKYKTVLKLFECIDMNYFLDVEIIEKEKHPMLFIYKNVSNNKNVADYFFRKCNLDNLSYPHNMICKLLRYCYDRLELDDVTGKACSWTGAQFFNGSGKESDRVWGWIPLNESEALELIKKKYLM